MQTTVRRAITLEGKGLHSGRPARLTVLPAPAGAGIVVRRVDVTDVAPTIPAIWSAVRQEPLCTTLVNEAGVSVATVEHAMAALAGCGVHNAVLEVDGPELPILDGSAAPVARAILAAGLHLLDAPVRALKIMTPVTVSQGAARASLHPAERFSIGFEIDFPDAAIGHQELSLDMANGAFLRELCDSRTFCRRADVEAMRAVGKARGGTLLNAVVVEEDRVLTPGGLRHADEPVRHKMLDALGDLALVGAPLIGRYEGVRAGHALTNTLLRQLFATPGATAWVSVDADLAARLPGASLTAADLAAVA